ncbi:lysylphosphatidylglycerol synthase domain-containing protein [Enterococcus pingfangensis]|uniref:lysylphosphatidylglycerol synthase domain-containing protein n=1 Tax=Enterococcus pingfangensis TaxID=2559924 RepID=UPI0010F71EB4|nr:lysylphosphatidylglycerol synthase domain-containing protein [Enterococcus pingfangensis]
MKKQVNKYLKIIGNVVTIIAVVFILRKLMRNDVDYQSLFKTKNILSISIVVIVQSIIVITNAFPWKTLVEMMTNIPIPFSETIPVYVKSNLMKYVPGNVFQFVGRNELAIKKDLPHIKVATATFLDILMTVIAASLISIIFLFNFIWSSIQENAWAHLLSLGILILVIIIAIILFIFRKKILSLIKKQDYLFTKKSLKKIFICLFYYVVILMVSSLMYMLVIMFILDIPLTPSLFINLFSANTLAWLVGFITPGAPAGIGIKEAVMVGVTGGLINTSTITFSMVIMRVLLTIADVLAFGFVKFYEYGKKINR